MLIFFATVKTNLFLSIRWILVLSHFRLIIFAFNIFLTFECCFYRFSSQSLRCKREKSTEFSQTRCTLALGISWSCFSDTVSRCRQCKSAVLHVSVSYVFFLFIFFSCVRLRLWNFVFSETQITFTVLFTVNNFQVEFFINADFIQISRHVGMLANERPHTIVRYI